MHYIDVKITVEFTNGTTRQFVDSRFPDIKDAANFFDGRLNDYNCIRIVDKGIILIPNKEIHDIIIEEFK